MKAFKKNAKFTMKYLKNHKYKMILIIFSTIVILALRIITPIISAKIIVSLTNNLFKQVILLAFVLLLIDYTWVYFWYVQNQLYRQIYTDVFSRIQNDLGASILRLNNKTLERNSSGVFIQRLTGDTSTIADSFKRILSEISGILSSVGTLVAIFIVSIPAGIFSIISIIISIIISTIRVKIWNKNDKRLRKINEKTTGFIGELVRGARDIRMLNSEKSFLSALKEKVDYNNMERYKAQTTNNRMFVLEFLSRDTFEELMIVFLIILIALNKITITIGLVIHNYQGKVVGFADSIGYLIEAFKDYNLSCSRIFSIIESDEFKKEEFGNSHLKKVKGNFEFKNVVFGYTKNKKILNGLSFKVKSKSTVAFVGKSGSGKTTIFSLLCKMYNVNDGEILIDGVNINQLDKDSIRGNITIISQDPYIFNLSIKENLQLVKSDLTNKEMKEACKMACLDEFIESLPQKYDTIIGEGGVNLSGGQRQRLAIARAFVQKTEIILFDEATSSLDNETQNGIQQAIHNLKKDYTILIIAHRLSTIKDCDNIFLISDGKVSANGTHEVLMKKSKLYKDLYESEIEK